MCEMFAETAAHGPRPKNASLAKDAQLARICGEAATPAPPLTGDLSAKKRKVRTRPDASKSPSIGLAGTVPEKLEFQVLVKPGDSA
jgi:hypothetical protein